jgi:hypothetical protein
MPQMSYKIVSSPFQKDPATGLWSFSREEMIDKPPDNASLTELPDDP